MASEKFWGPDVVGVGDGLGEVLGSGVAEILVVGAVLPPRSVARTDRDARRRPAPRAVQDDVIVDYRGRVDNARGHAGEAREDLERRGARLAADDRAVGERVIRLL
jgi:hypothetical protein